MNRNDHEALARLSAIGRRLVAISDWTAKAITQQGSQELPAGTLRAIGSELVSLTGELTTLGVNMAHRANERDKEANIPIPETGEIE